MKIAYLILCHSDATHVGRLARHVTARCDENMVFIHVDAKSDIFPDLVEEVKNHPRIFLIDRRIPVFWGGFSAVRATYALLHAAVEQGHFDRYVLMQGSDYPINSNSDISRFFDDNRKVEYLRSVNCSSSDIKYIYAKARYSLKFDNINLVNRIRNKIVHKLDLKTKPRTCKVDGRDWSIYWGCAQFAVTHECVKLFLKYENNSGLIKHFSDLFPADELFFHTILYNDALCHNTAFGGPESDADISRLTDLTNLTYFEYPKLVTIFEDADYERLQQLPHLYIRKVTTERSTPLLDRIDAD